MKTLTKWFYVSLTVLSLVLLYFFLNSQYFLNAEYIFKDYILRKSSVLMSDRLIPLQEQITFVDIDKKTMDAYHKVWPMDRKAMALLARRLKDAKAIIFSISIEGATGTSGDDALEKVLRLQHNVFVPIRFKQIYTPVAGIAPADRVILLPWRKILPYCFVGVLDFYQNPIGNIEGFYPIIGYRGQMISHMVLKVLAFLRGFDDKSFVFSKKSKRLEWALPDSSRFTLPVDYYKGVGLNLAPYALPKHKIESISFTDVLPEGLYRKYKNRGISIMPYAEAADKIFVVGTSEPSVAENVPTIIGQMPLHHVLGYSLSAVLQGSFIRSLPIFLQYLVLILCLGLMAFVFINYRWSAAIVIILLEISGYLFASYFLLTHSGIFVFAIKPIIALLAVFPVILLLKNFHRKIMAQKKEIEAGIITEIKEKTTLLPPSDLPWIDTRIKEVKSMHIAGGMYDFVPMDNKHVAIAVADVFSSGKDALLKISYLRGFLKSQTTISRQPGEVVYSMNKALVKNNSLNMTCRFIYLLFDAVKNKLVYSGAGGVSFIVLGAEGTSVRCFEAEERILLGISREIFYEPREIPLKKGDIVIIYTPNIFSMKNKNGRSYDVDRLGKLVLANHKLPAGALIERLSRDIKSFIGQENLQDFALIAVKWLNEPVVENEENIYVGISKKERDMLLFFKGKKKGNK